MLREFVGMTGTFEIIELFAAVTNSDTAEGRGHAVDKSYHLSRDGALIGAARIGVMGNDGAVEERTAIRLNDEMLILLTGEPIAIADETAMRERVRKEGMEKLSAAQRAALGI